MSAHLLRGALMACDAPPRECLAWHILPRLISGRMNEAGTSVRALCPAHDDREHSLGVSVGEQRRVVWQCFAGCTRTRVRAELVGLGVPSGCLPLVTREKEDILDVIRQAVTGDTPDHGAVRLRVLAALDGYARPAEAAAQAGETTRQQRDRLAEYLWRIADGLGSAKICWRAEFPPDERVMADRLVERLMRMGGRAKRGEIA